MSTQVPLTVGLPVYNGERYLEGALDSLLEQTYAEFQLVISDNASTDRTREICLERSLRDARIRYQRNEANLGAAENYNRVFRGSQSEYFKWATHDDRYAPAFLARCIDTLEERPDAVLCYAPALFIDEDGQETGRENDEPDYTGPRADQRLHAWLFEKREGWCHPVMGVIRSKALGRTGLIGKYTSSDRVLIAELSLHGSMVRLPEHLYYRRDHAGRSAGQGRTVSDVTAWYDSSARSDRVYMPRWRWGIEYAKAVARAPMTFSERAACAGVVARWFNTRRGILARELVRWLRRGHKTVGEHNGAKPANPARR